MYNTYFCYLYNTNLSFFRCDCEILCVCRNKKTDAPVTYTSTMESFHAALQSNSANNKWPLSQRLFAAMNGTERSMWVVAPHNGLAFHCARVAMVISFPIPTCTPLLLRIHTGTLHTYIYVLIHRLNRLSLTFIRSTPASKKSHTLGRPPIFRYLFLFILRGAIK